MTVKDLINILLEFPTDTEVHIEIQPKDKETIDKLVKDDSVFCSITVSESKYETVSLRINNE
jgi:hypothetical protein